MSANIARIVNLLSICPKYIIETMAIWALLLYLVILILTQGDYSAYLGQLSVFAIASFRLLPAVNSIYTYFGIMVYNRPSVEVIYRDIKEADELCQYSRNCQRNGEKTEICFDNRISVDEVSFGYNTDTLILNGANMSIEKGQSIGIVGKSGGGKTTMVDIILGLLTVQKGEVSVDGVSIYNDYSGWLQRIGYIPQTIFLVDSSIRENIAFGIDRNEIDDVKVNKAVEEAQLSEFVDSLADGLNTIVGEAGIRLSGGQRQRIGIARALYNDPDVLVLDEATSALDNETESAVMESIDRLHGSKTLIIIAHRLTTIQGCDKIFEIKDGKAYERDHIWISKQMEFLKQ